jgi:hypothetical protein
VLIGQTGPRRANRPAQGIGHRHRTRPHTSPRLRTAIELLLVGGLLIFELGFFNLIGFDGFTDTEKLFVTGLRSQKDELVMSR